MFNSYFSYLVRLSERHTPSELLRLRVTSMIHYLILGDQLQNAFVVPTAQDGFQLAAVDRKATPMVTWTTNFTRMSLSIWEDVGRGAYDGAKYAETELFDNINALDFQYPWESLFSSSTSPNSNWYLSIKDESGSGQVFNSTYFTISDSAEPHEQELRKREDSTNTFINPPATDLNDPIAKDYTLNPIYEEGTPFTITWNTNLTSYVLAFWQDLLCNPSCSNGPFYLDDALTEDSSQSFDWTVSPDPYTLSDSKVFWFALYENVDGQLVEGTPPIHGHYFNITTATSSSSSTSTASTTSKTATVDSNQQAPSTTSTPASSTATTTTTTNTSSALAALASGTKIQEATTTKSSSSSSLSPQSTSSPTDSSDSSDLLTTKSTSNSSLSTGAKIGIALGSIALVIFLASFGYALYRYGQRKGSMGSNTLPDAPSSIRNSMSRDFFPASGGARSVGYSRSIGELSGYSEGSVRPGVMGEMEGVGRYSLVPEAERVAGGRGTSGRSGIYELPGGI